MGTLLAYTLPYSGHVFPLLPPLVELAGRGHDVVLAAGPRRFEHLPDVLRTVPTSPALLPSSAPPDPHDAQALAAHQQGLFARRGEGALFDLERLIEEERPDALLVDPMLWGGMIAAEASRLPWAMAAHSCFYLPAMGARITGPGLPPPEGLLRRVRYWAAARAIGKAIDRHRLPGVNRLRAARGLSPLAHARDLYARAPLTLSFTAEPFEYPRSDWHRSVRFVGPGLWDPPHARPEWIDRLDDRPLVLLTTATIDEHPSVRAWVRPALEALADEPLQVIAALPRGEAPDSLPTNVRVEPFLPLGELLPRAACVVSHGGTGVTQRALAAGVPVLVIPLGQDRLEVARRVEVARAGVMLPPSEVTPARVKEALREAMRCVPGALAVAESFRAAGGAAAAADAIETVLCRSPFPIPA